MEEIVKRKRKEFAKLLREQRAETGMTQYELADAAGVGRPSVACWECGYNFPRLDSMVRLAEAMGKDLRICFVDKENQGEA